jgi:WD40 repeat protein
LSIDFDDPGELCMTSESDETIQIYNVKDGRHDKSLLSKKYGVKLAKFTHTSSSIIYASTQQNGRLYIWAWATSAANLVQTRFATWPHTTTRLSATLRDTKAQ